MANVSEEEISELKAWYREEFAPELPYHFIEFWYETGTIRDEHLESLTSLLNRLAEVTPDDPDSDPMPVRIIVDYRGEILELARKHCTSQQHRIANVFYAMWFEHTLNLVLNAALRRQGLARKRINEILRSTSTRDKTGWLLELCDLPAIEADVKQTLSFLFNERNGFVHYKFKPTDPDDEEEDLRARNASKRAEAAVSFMREYEEEALYRGNREKVRARITELLQAADLPLPPSAPGGQP